MLERMDGHLFGEDQACFGCGPKHPFGFHLKFEREGDQILTRFLPGPQYQGPPGIMHGGLVMTLADEVGQLLEQGVESCLLGDCSHDALGAGRRSLSTRTSRKFNRSVVPMGLE